MAGFGSFTVHWGKLNGGVNLSINFVFPKTSCVNVHRNIALPSTYYYVIMETILIIISLPF